MPAHAIRLRAAWEVRPAPDAPWARIDLPLSPDRLPTGPAILRRRFRTPPLDPEAEELWLVLEDIPGVDSVALNGREWIPEGAGLAARIEGRAVNLLELRLGAAGGREAAIWGMARLEVRRRGGAEPLR